VVGSGVCARVDVVSAVMIDRARFVDTEYTAEAVFKSSSSSSSVSSCVVSETKALTDRPNVVSLGAPNLPCPLRTDWDSISLEGEEGGWRWRCLRPSMVPSNNDSRGSTSV
jgi:hypothetical protein